MAILAFTDAFVSINSVTLSTRNNAVAISMSNDELEAGAMGDVAHRAHLGLAADQMTFTFFQDFAAGNVDATLSALLGSNTGIAVSVRPTSAVVSATNPNYNHAAMVMTSYNPIDGSHGGLLQTQATFKPNNGARIVRSTS